MPSRREVLTTRSALAAGECCCTTPWWRIRPPRSPIGRRRSRSRRCGRRGSARRCTCKIETNHGITGWGEIKGVDPRVSKPLAESLFELLDGENPTRIEHLWQKLYRAHRDMRGGPFMVHTLAGIDMALWDITGKLWGVPVYRLLGGPMPRPHPRLPHAARRRRCRRTASTSTRGNPADIDRMVDADQGGPRAGRARRRGHVRRPLRRAAGHADPARRRHQALRRAVHRGAGGAGQHRGVQAAQGADLDPAGGRRARPHDLGVPPLPAERLPRHPAARLLPHRRHHAR